MSSKITLPGTVDIQEYEPLLARYNLYVAAVIAFVLVFLAGVAFDIYLGY